MNKPDRRLAKTRQAVFEAFARLLQTQRYSGITIQEIIDEANIGRTTFYSHFETKDDLLIAFIDMIFDSLKLSDSDVSVQGDIAFNNASLSAIFAHIQENSRLIKGIINTECSELLFRKFKEYWNERVLKTVSLHKSSERQPKVPEVILSNHISATLIELIKWWLNSNMSYTSEQMAQYYVSLILPIIE